MKAIRAAGYYRAAFSANPAKGKWKVVRTCGAGDLKIGWNAFAGHGWFFIGDPWSDSIQVYRVQG